MKITYEVIQGHRSIELVAEADVLSGEAVTPYAAAKIVNGWLHWLDLDVRGERTLPPQMFYNYVRSGYIPSTIDGRIELAVLGEWFTKYVDKRLKVTK